MWCRMMQLADSVEQMKNKYEVENRSDRRGNKGVGFSILGPWFLVLGLNKVRGPLDDWYS